MRAMNILLDYFGRIDFYLCDHKGDTASSLYIEKQLHLNNDTSKGNLFHIKYTYTNNSMYSIKWYSNDIFQAMQRIDSILDTWYKTHGELDVEHVPSTYRGVSIYLTPKKFKE